MNERIKTLSIYAGVIPHRETQAQCQETLDIQKFADLLLMEVYGVLDDKAEEYVKQRMLTYDFTEKNICAEGERALLMAKYKIMRKFEGLE